jgi:hypothetical protein
MPLSGAILFRSSSTSSGTLIEMCSFQIFSAAKKMSMPAYRFGPLLFVEIRDKDGFSHSISLLETVEFTLEVVQQQPTHSPNPPLTLALDLSDRLFYKINVPDIRGWSPPKMLFTG